MMCRLDVIPYGRSRLRQLGVVNSAVTEDLAWADDPTSENCRRRSTYLRTSRATAVDNLHRITQGRIAPPYKWLKAEALSQAPLSVLDHLKELSLRSTPVPWQFTLWRPLITIEPATRESAIIRASVLADELERAAELDERDYSRALLERDKAYIDRLVERLLTVAVGPPSSARPAIRLIARLCCHHYPTWQKLGLHLRSHPLGHRDHLILARMLGQPGTPDNRVVEISTGLLHPESHEFDAGELTPGMSPRCWNVQELACETLGLLPTSEAVTQRADAADGAPAADPTARHGSRSDADVDYTAAFLPRGLWPPEELQQAEEALKRRTRFLVTRLREQAADGALGARPDGSVPDPVSARLRQKAVNPHLSWRVRALAADGYRTHRPGEFWTVPDRASGQQKRTGGEGLRLVHAYRGNMADILTSFETDIGLGLDPSGGLTHAHLVFQALESCELRGPGEPPQEQHGLIADYPLLRQSPAVAQVLEGILDAVLPDPGMHAGRESTIRPRPRPTFSESFHHLVDGLDADLDIHSAHEVPSAAGRGLRVLIRTMLASLDTGRERRAVTTLVAAGMTVPTMCVLNRLLRADLDGELDDHRATFLVELALLYLGHLGENPLAGVVVVRWLERRWREWRVEMVSTRLLEPSEDQSAPDPRQAWPTGEDLAAYLRSRHRMELLHTAVWALGDIRWDAMADQSGRKWFRPWWKRGVALLYDVATFGLGKDGEEATVGGIPSALAALRQAACYTLSVTRWEELDPADADARDIAVRGSQRRQYSHDEKGEVEGARPIGDGHESPAQIARSALDAIATVTIDGRRPPVLTELAAWGRQYRQLMYPPGAAAPAPA